MDVITGLSFVKGRKHLPFRRLSGIPFCATDAIHTFLPLPSQPGLWQKNKETPADFLIFQ
ncbi:hypothetical protein [Dickeya chrysanthemi]|uniref:hypothetical protein n=1 Tax=Dickeya chrysanthemi TaxID=556 RepID=UPI0003A15AF7|nr:hypothetical protein [Dickeya chrysanthemi]